MSRMRNTIKARVYNGCLIVMVIGIPVLLFLGPQLEGQGLFAGFVFALAAFVLLAVYVIHTNQLGRRN